MKGEELEGAAEESPASRLSSSASSSSPLTARALVSYGASRLVASASSAAEDPRGEARRLLGIATGHPSADLWLRAEEPVWWAARSRFLDLVARRAEGVPLQWLAGEAGFHDVVIAVEPGVFVPRPETELLVEEALQAIAVRRRGDAQNGVRVLDVGTGSGAIAVAIAAAERGRHTEVYAGDVDARAVRIARANAARSGVHVDVRCSDLFGAFADLAGTVDVVVSNPPYISPSDGERLPIEVRGFDPPGALFDPDGGTGFHRRIAASARAFLRPGGTLILEIGATQGREVAGMLVEAGYVDVSVVPDLAGRDRMTRGLWEGKGSAWTPSS